MTLIATPAKPGLWLDTSEGQALTDAVLSALVTYGVAGVFGYLPLPGNDARNDWTPNLLQRVCAKGLQASFVQHVRTGPHGLWRPAEHDATADARYAAGYLKGLGAPDGVHMAQDLEACDGASADSAFYTDAWGKACLAAGYKHRLYVGFSALMSPVTLYGLPTPNSYWSDAGHREVAVRGVDTKQGAATLRIAGVEFDTNVVAPDLKGDVFVACAAAPEAVS